MFLKNRTFVADICANVVENYEQEQIHKHKLLNLLFQAGEIESVFLGTQLGNVKRSINMQVFDEMSERLT